ncbi:hypothetical protein BH11PSE2_BH11PSE2_11420 [soil metagenome]
MASAMALGVAAVQAQPPAPAPLDAAARKAAVTQAATALRNDYIFPDVGVRAAEKIEAALAAGAYDSLDTPSAFATKLTADLADVAHDKHLRVLASGAPPAPTPGAPVLPPPPKAEAGVVRADRLPGGIGYIEISGFPPAAAFKPALDRAMASLKDTPALILDLRRNGGGSPDGVAYLISFFIDGAKPVLLNDFSNRISGTQTFRTSQTFTSPTPTAYLGKKIYVLTSSFTFSGGEEAAYDMQSFRLGTLVGETTGGGANPGGTRPIGPQLGIFLPNGRPTNAITKTNWEGVGVIPDIATPAPEALKVALTKLGQTPTAANIEALSQARLFEPRSTPAPGTEAALRRMLDELAKGEPRYDLMSPSLANATRTQLPTLQQRLTAIGPIQSIAFLEVDGGGLDTYTVKGSEAALIWGVTLGPDGKVTNAVFRLAPAAR